MAIKVTQKYVISLHELIKALGFSPSVSPTLGELLQGFVQTVETPIPTVGQITITHNAEPCGDCDAGLNVKGRDQCAGCNSAKAEEFPADWSDDVPAAAAPQFTTDPMAALLELAEDFSVLEDARFSVDVRGGQDENGKRKPLKMHISAGASFAQPLSETV